MRYISAASGHVECLHYLFLFGIIYSFVVLLQNYVFTLTDFYYRFRVKLDGLEVSVTST